MAEAAIEGTGSRWFSRFNWWKIGFFLALFAFELTRELLVLANFDRPSLLISKIVYTESGLIHAEGRWRRTDGGDKLSPSMTTIDCSRSSQSCRVIEVGLFNGNVLPPEVDEFPAEFTANGVRYSWRAGCVKYDVLIDAEAQQALNVRTIIPATDRPNVTDCGAYLDDRIEMVLSDGYGQEFGDYAWPEDSFLPLLRGIAWFFG